MFLIVIKVNVIFITMCGTVTKMEKKSWRVCIAAHGRHKNSSFSVHADDQIGRNKQTEIATSKNEND